jgi:hypothetical protein
MNCEKAKNLITIGIYGKLTASQKQELESHLKECPECARLYEKSAPLMNYRIEDKDIPSPDMDKSWKIISEQHQKSKRSSRIIPAPKWVLVASSFLIVFIIGYFAGKEVLKTGPKDFTGNTVTPLSFASYADHLKPVLINFVNQGRRDIPEDVRRLEKEIISDMLFQTRLLKELGSHNRNPEMLDLLQDMEFILVSMSNLESGKQEEAQHLIRMIQEKNISFRLKELITVKSSI